MVPVAQKPQPIDCIVVTHGDADHFSGLTQIFKSEGNPQQRKRLFMQPERIYHNGIVKRGSDRKEQDLLGPTRKTADGVFLTGLEQNLLTVADTEMNKPFLDWKNALKEYNKRSKLQFRRLEFGDDTAFDFLDTPDLQVDVLGPITTQVGGKPALKFLGNPPKARGSGMSRWRPPPNLSRGCRHRTPSMVIPSSCVCVTAASATCSAAT